MATIILKGALVAGTLSDNTIGNAHFVRIVATAGTNTITVKDGSTVIYRGSIFCTDQTDYNVFDVHSGDYTTENSYDNDFVIL